VSSQSSRLAEHLPAEFADVACLRVPGTRKHHINAPFVSNFFFNAPGFLIPLQKELSKSVPVEFLSVLAEHQVEVNLVGHMVFCLNAQVESRLYLETVVEASLSCRREGNLVDLD
jgi:hypothetical protein